MLFKFADTPFYQIKNLRLKKQNMQDINKIYKCTNIKLISFYIFTFIFFGFYWYVVVIFCAVYENTQISYLKDTLLSFLFSIILPFVIYLIPSGLRICAIRDEKMRLRWLYKLSDIIPFF